MGAVRGTTERAQRALQVSRFGLLYRRTAEAHHFLYGARLERRDMDLGRPQDSLHAEHNYAGTHRDSASG